MEYQVNGVNVKYEPVGERRWGEDHVLLETATDLTSLTNWSSRGFVVESLFDAALWKSFESQIKTLLLKCWRDSGLPVDDNFKLDQYHVIASDRQAHLNAVERTRLLQISDLPIAVKIIEERISEICKVSLVARNPFDNESIFHFRVIRPNQGDNNPLHRDVWLEDYANCINLYIPIAGSNDKSSLILLPGSHSWPESRIEKTVGGALINDVKFNVPAVTSIEGSHEVLRPDPKLNEVLVFSPYLIHGGSVNLNKDVTRISIEMRLWKR